MEIFTDGNRAAAQNTLKGVSVVESIASPLILIEPHWERALHIKRKLICKLYSWLMSEK